MAKSGSSQTQHQLLALCQRRGEVAQPVQLVLGILNADLSTRSGGSGHRRDKPELSIAEMPPTLRTPESTSDHCTYF